MIHRNSIRVDWKHFGDSAGFFKSRWIGIICLIASSLDASLQAQPALPLDPPSIDVTVDGEQKPEIDSPRRFDRKLADKIAPLLEKLELGTVLEREEAEKELLNIGPAILSHLPHLPSSIVGPYRETLDRIRDAMQSKAIGEYAEPSTVTLKGKMPAGDVLLEFIEQTDNQLSIDQIPIREMDVNFDQTTFWEALDNVLDELGLEATTSAQDASLKLIPAKAEGNRAARGAYAGVFRIEPLRIDATRSIRSDRLSYLNLEILLMWEPRLRPVYFNFPMRSVLVECDNGEILNAVSPDSSPEYTPSDAHSIEANLKIELPSRSAKSISRISGTVLSAIPGAMVQLEFDELDNPDPKNQRVGNLNVSIEKTTQRDEIYEFNLLISLRDAGQTMDSFRGWMTTHEAYVINGENQRISNAGWQTYQMNNEAVGLTYFFDLGPSAKDCRLIYSAPGAVSEQQVDFILKDIPLP